MWGWKKWRETEMKQTEEMSKREKRCECEEEVGTQEAHPGVKMNEPASGSWVWWETMKEG